MKERDWAKIVVSVFGVIAVSLIIGNVLGIVNLQSIASSMNRSSGFYVGDQIQWTATYTGTWLCSGAGNTAPKYQAVIAYATLKHPNGSTEALGNKNLQYLTYTCGSSANKATVVYYATGLKKISVSQAGTYTLGGYIYFGSNKVNLDSFSFAVSSAAPVLKADGALCSTGQECLSGKCAGSACTSASACSATSGCVFARSCFCGATLLPYAGGYCKNGQTIVSAATCNPTPTPTPTGTATCIMGYARCANGYYQFCTPSSTSIGSWVTQQTACPSVCASLPATIGSDFVTNCKNAVQQATGDSTPQDGAQTTCAMKLDKPCESATWNGDALCTWDETACGGTESCLSDTDCGADEYCAGDGTCVALGASPSPSPSPTVNANGTKQCGLGFKLNEETGNCDPDWMLAGAIAVIFAAAMVVIYLVTRRNK